MTFSRQCDVCDGEGKVPQHQCTTCKGKGVTSGRRTAQVRIPNGIDNDQSLRLVNQGEPGPRGGRPGHLFIRVQVSPHELFRRDGLNVHLDVPVSFGQAVLGDTLLTPTLTGEVELKIPEGTQPDEKRVLRGKGIRDPRGRTGDQFVHFKVQVPRNLTSRQQELMKEFESITKQEEAKVKSSPFGFFKSAVSRWRDMIKKTTTS
eukprot:TRINITY_DN6021_c0_g1_i3.p1 TRINITY_DN6021_c0_g1~~TRINITY_DN6021_c0_g1_i3.p1  ORF type:complete len:204 (+),score=53.54 TRINITY_DN6021_c0_g1_i3:215-826(+)